MIGPPRDLVFRDHSLRHHIETKMSKSSTQGSASVFDTHCEGAGLLKTTKTWSKAYRRFRQFEGLGLDATYSIHLPRSLPPRVNLKGKNVIISGSNSGIGLEAAYIFALWGANVILACRPNVPAYEMSPEDACREIVNRGSGNIDPKQLEVWDLDLSSLKSAEDLGKKWLQTGKPLDYLINNAGLSSPKYIVTEDGFELTRSVNYLGHCLLSLVLLPAMKKAQSPRIVNTCSCFHYQGNLDFSNLDYEKSQGQIRGPGGVQAYCDTKLQHLMWTKELQNRLSESEEYRHVIVNGVHPGFIGSNIWKAPGISDLAWPQPQLLNWIVSSLSVSTQQGSLCLLYGALHPSFGLRPSELEKLPKNANANTSIAKGLTAQIGGHYIQRDRAETPRPECFDRLARSRLWQRTLEDLKAEQRGLIKELPGHPVDLF